jgi:hypothetical protein
MELTHYQHEEDSLGALPVPVKNAHTITFLKKWIYTTMPRQADNEYK